MGKGMTPNQRFLLLVASARFGLEPPQCGIEILPLWRPFRRCQSLGLVRYARREVFLTVAGATAAGLPASAAHDPSTWPDRPRTAFYTRGFCHVLAVAMNRLRGLPIAVLRDPHPDFSGPDGSPGVVHAFCLLPDGGAVDARGRFDAPADVARGLVRRRVAVETLGDESALAPYVAALSHLAPFDPEDIDVASRVAERLLATLDLGGPGTFGPGRS